MPGLNVAKIAVSGVPFRLDRPYDYSIPPALEGNVAPGVRVEVPFGRANRPSEGIVLALAEGSDFDKLKPVTSVLDAEPLLDSQMLSLAMWMHERFFCTVYEAVKAALPAGFWFKGGKMRQSGKYITIASLAVPGEEAAEAAARKRGKAPQQSEILKTLCAVGRAELHDLLEFSGAKKQSLASLVNQGFITLDEKEVFRRPEVKAEPSRVSAPSPPGKRPARRCSSASPAPGRLPSTSASSPSS